MRIFLGGGGFRIIVLNLDNIFLSVRTIATDVWPSSSSEFAVCNYFGDVIVKVKYIVQGEYFSWYVFFPDDVEDHVKYGGSKRIR